MQNRRKEAYDIINELGTKFKNEIEEHFGRNYTRLKTDVLWKYIDENTEEIIEAPHLEKVNDIYDSIKYRVKVGILYPDDVIVLADLLTELGARMHEEEMAS